MNPTPPWPASLTALLEPLRQGAAALPPWLLDEGRRRLLAVLNHVLQQEPEALARLTRQKGRLVELAWRSWRLRLRITPAGLLEALSESEAATTAPDLSLVVDEPSPWQLAQTALRGDKPPVQIAGDVQLAAEVNWLVDHVRWDFEEDLARLLGDAPAHAIGSTLRRLGAALRSFAAPGTEAGTAASPTAGPGQGGGA